MEFETIFRTYFNDVFRYILRLSGSESLADEITAETFFKAMHSIDRFRGDCDIRVWLCQIAKNCYFTYLKKTNHSDRIDETELLHVADFAANVEETLIRRDDVARIQAVLHEISDPYKEVFMWRIFAELSFKQIGQIFGKSENWACVTYHRARLKIKELLEATNNEK